MRPLAATTPSIEGPRTIVTAKPFTATVTGSPRIGPKRELKRATEGYWAGRTSRSELEKVAATLRHDTWAQLAAAGLDSVPVNTFSYYDQVLDTAVLLGALPERVQAVSDDLDRYFAAARGTGDIAPLEMTKWFDTNYHYIVPEIGPKTKFSLHPEKVLSELKEARDLGITARPVIIGPVTFLLLSKAVDGAGAPIERLDELVPLYTDLLGQLADKGVAWVQIDEPVLVTDISADAPALAERVYNTLGALDKRPAIHVATYFGDPGNGLAALARTPVEAIGVDFVYGADTAVASVPPSWPARRWWPESLTDATSGVPTWSRRWASWPACSVRSARWLSPRRARRCTCRTRWSPRPIWTTRCAAGWRSAPRRCTRSPRWQRR